MTFEKAVLEYLEGCGMFSKQSKEVFQAMVLDSENNGMTNRWQDDPNEYPDAVLNRVMVSARNNAKIWIDANCPEAFFRPMFI